MTRTKIALAATLIAATSSTAFASAHQHRNMRAHSAPALQQREVSLPTEGRSSVGPFWYNWSGPTSGGM